MWEAHLRGEAALTLSGLFNQQSPGFHVEMRMTNISIYIMCIDWFAEVSHFNQEMFLGKAREAVHGYL